MKAVTSRLVQTGSACCITRQQWHKCLQVRKRGKALEQGLKCDVSEYFASTCMQTVMTRSEALTSSADASCLRSTLNSTAKQWLSGDAKALVFFDAIPFSRLPINGVHERIAQWMTYGARDVMLDGSRQTQLCMSSTAFVVTGSFKISANKSHLSRRQVTSARLLTWL